MKRSLVLFLVVGLSVMWAQGKKKGMGGAPNTLTAQEQKDGWELLFDGNSMDKWDVTPALAKVWSVVNGTIKCDSSAAGGTLLTKEDFADFVVRAEFRANPDINSGIMLRNPRPRPVTAGEKKSGGGQGYEVQIRDKDPGHYSGGSFLTASLVSVQKAPETAKIKPGEWNTFEITAQGDHFVIVYNGQQVVDAHDSKLKNGAIGLQLAHPEDARGADIEFRSIKVKRLSGGGTTGGK